MVPSRLKGLHNRTLAARRQRLVHSALVALGPPASAGGGGPLRGVPCYLGPPPGTMIFLDHNATTPLDPRVLERMVAVLGDPALQGNPSSVHAAGQRARGVVERARRGLAAALGCEPLEITFTSGGTEADNLAVLGVGRALRAAGRPCGVLTSPLEHPAVLSAAQQLGREGHPVALVPVDGAGRIAPAAVEAIARDRPEIGLVSLAAVNHEIGNAYPVAALAAAARRGRPEALVHCDAVQALGRVPVDFAGWGVDLLSVSAHKIYGPKGIGALIHRRHLEVAPLFYGGHQERGRRPGTEAPATIAGFARAAELAAAELGERAARARAATARLRAGLRDIQGARVLGDPEGELGCTTCATFAGCEGQLLLINLDLAGICVSTGAACSAGSLGPSPALLALGLSPEEAGSALRISTGKDTTDAEIDALLAALPEAIARVRGEA